MKKMSAKIIINNKTKIITFMKTKMPRINKMMTMNVFEFIYDVFY
jgi:hypothetical protein